MHGSIVCYVVVQCTGKHDTMIVQYVLLGRTARSATAREPNSTGHEGQAPAAQAHRGGGVVREPAVVDAAAERDAADGDAGRLSVPWSQNAGRVGAVAVGVAVAVPGG
jgi:hypothetical protein